MPCWCKDSDGSPALKCLGICKGNSTSIDAVSYRQEKSIEDRVEYILSIFLLKVEDKINLMQQVADNQYRQGFREGFNFARDVYE